MEQTNYNVDYFIKKFEAIPESKWCTQKIDNGNGQYWALGHCDGWGEFDSLSELLGGKAALTNNGNNPIYQQPTPKQRILAALYDIKKLQQPAQPEWKDITSDLAVLPVSETSDLINHTQTI